MELESGLNFENISSLAILNSRAKFEFKLLQIKFLGKGIQEKLYLLLLLLLLLLLALY